MFLAIIAKYDASHQILCKKKMSVHYCLLLCLCFVTCAESMYFKLGMVFMKHIISLASVINITFFFSRKKKYENM